MSTKKLDEVATMINSFLEDKKNKINESKNESISKKNNAFWTSIVESVMLEMGREDPEDWRQSFDSSDGSGLRNRDFGGFGVEDSDTDKVGVPLSSIEDEGEKKSRKSTSMSGSGRTNQQKRLEIISNLATKVFSRMAEIVAKNEPIPSNLSSFSIKFFGFDPKKNAAAKNILVKLANGEKINPETISPFIKKALETNSSELIQFANTRLDMYPGDWQDEIENRANKTGVPGSSDKERGIGTGVKTVYSDPKPGYRTAKADKEVAKAPDEIKKSIVQRKETGNTPVYRTFKDFDIDDIMKYYDYYQNNPKEIDRARKERVGAPPQSLQDITGKIADAPDAKATLKGQKGEPNPNQEVEIGSRSASSILSKQEKEKAKTAWDKKASKGIVDFEPSLDLDPKDVLSRLSDFGSDEDPSYPSPDSIQGRAATGLANVLSSKSERIQSAKDEYHKVAELVKPLFVKQNVEGKELSPEEANRLSKLTRELKAKREQIEKLGQRQKVSPDTVADLMAKMSVRDSRGNFVKLQDPDKVEWNSEEEEEMGRQLYNRFDLKRLNLRPSDKDSRSPFRLKDFIPDFASSEEEKVAANIPAQKGSKSFEKRLDDQDRAVRSAKEAEKNKGLKLSPDEVSKTKQDDRDNKDRLAREILKRKINLQRDQEETRSSEKGKLVDRLAALGFDVSNNSNIEKVLDDEVDDSPISNAEKTRLRKMNRDAKATVGSDIPKHVYAGPREPGAFPSVGSNREAAPYANKALVNKLIQDASKKLVLAGEEPTPQRLLQHIATNFTRGPGGKSGYPKEFDGVRDFFLHRAKTLRGSLGEAKYSILELLSDIGTKGNKHADPKKTDGLDKGKPAKKLDMVPKWKKSKMKLSKLFKGKDK